MGHQGLYNRGSIRQLGCSGYLCAGEPPRPRKIREISRKISFELEGAACCIKATEEGYIQCILHTDYLHYGQVWQGQEVGRADMAVMLMKQDLPPSSGGNLMSFFFFFCF